MIFFTIFHSQLMILFLNKASFQQVDLRYLKEIVDLPPLT